MNLSPNPNNQLTTQWVQPIWAQQNFETQENFEAFECFRSLPSRHRNMSEVARYCSIPRERVLELSQSHHWKARIEKHDEFVRAGNRDLLRQSNGDRAARHLSLLEKVHESVEREFDNLLEKQRQLDAQKAGVSLMKPAELRALLSDMIKLGRLVTGEATERTEDVYDLSKLSVQELTTWKKLIAKVKAP